MEIRSEQRWSNAHPCPICGGYESMKQGTGQRCWGYESTDGEYIYCTRDEFAGGLSTHKGSDAYAHRAEGDCKCGSVHGHASASIPIPPPEENKVSKLSFPSVDALTDHYKDKGGKGGSRLEDYYLYCLADGPPSLAVLRFRDENGKKFFYQATPQGDGWSLGARAWVPIPYRLPELLDAIRKGEDIYIVEGEKDAEAIGEAGGVATCNAMGAGKPLADYVKHFHGASRIIIVADQDEPGEKHALAWKAMLQGVARSVTIRRPAEGKDAHDALVTHGYPLEEAFLSPPPEVDTSRFVHVGAERYKALREAPEPEWMVDSFLRRGKTTVLGGSPMSGKTWLGLQVASSLAAGLDVWPGAETKPTDGLVLYIGYDPHMSVEDVARRLDHLDRGPHRRGQGAVSGAWAERFVTVGHSEASGPFPVDRYRMSAEGADRLAEEVIYPLHRERGKIAAIVVDTLSSALPERVDENSSADMNAVISRLSMLGIEFQAAVLTLHHPTKAATSSNHAKGFDPNNWTSYFRGSSAIPAAAGVVAGLWNPPNHPGHRVLTSWGNSARRNRVWLEVTNDEDRAVDGMVDYFIRTEAPEGGAATDPADAMERLAAAFPEYGKQSSYRGFVRATERSVSGAARGRADRLIKDLTEQGLLIREEEGGKKFSLTPEGDRAIRPYREEVGEE